MELREVQLIPRTLQAVEYTEAEAEAIRQWVQDNSPFSQIVRDPVSGRLYLPIAKGQSMDVVEYGEFILFDPVSVDFISTTAEAYHEFYQEVEA
jgi:hypothetical protein